MEPHDGDSEEAGINKMNYKRIKQEAGGGECPVRRSEEQRKVPPTGNKGMEGEGRQSYAVGPGESLSRRI